MKSLIVAAGQGTRLRPLTDSVPKCMVSYHDKCIIDHILDVMESCGVESNIVINGYKKDVLEKHLAQRNVAFVTNSEYETTNMVHTLFCAEDQMDDDIILSYADIIYKPGVLQKLIDSKADVSCVVDKKWKELWLQRMDNPLEDAETMKLNSDGSILELGKKPTGYGEIEGQYIGLLKFSREAIVKVRNFYHSLDKNAFYDGKDFRNMYMTSFVQMIIDKLIPVQSVCIEGGWLEIDCVEDLKSVMI